MSEQVNVGCGCFGCVGCFVWPIILVLTIWIMFFDLPIGDKVWNVDLFPPQIREVGDE